MAFALAVNNLMDALKQPGCPICRIGRLGARRALESFLWENVNEPDVRQGILDAYGFCPEHTRVMVAQELFTSSLPLGTNIIYEHLGRVVAGELKGLRIGGGGTSGGGSEAGPPAAAEGPGAARAPGRGDLRALLQKLGLARGRALPLPPRGPCPACQAAENAAANSLHVLCEELARPSAREAQGRGSDVLAAYRASDGICLAHMRAAVAYHGAGFAPAVRWMVDDAVQRLEQQSRDMKEYIRKNNWTYRDEKLTEAEDTAWRKTLAFFTGLPGESFTYKIED